MKYDSRDREETIEGKEKEKTTKKEKNKKRRKT
jgi:hypothetical protein